MANTFLLALGRQMGSSLVELDKVDLAKSLISKARMKLKLPLDSVISDQVTDDADTQVSSTDIPPGMQALDIGPKTARVYRDEIMQAKTIIWNGPMGVFEKEPFADGTQEIAEAVVEATQKNGALSIIGGGDSAAAVEQLGLSDKVSHVSTGGGASLEFIEKGHFSTLDILD
jgi:3-phosphoglycerate kinase